MKMRVKKEKINRYAAIFFCLLHLKRLFLVYGKIKHLKAPETIFIVVELIKDVI